jgi:hypothetical protein
MSFSRWQKLSDRMIENVVPRGGVAARYMATPTAGVASSGSERSRIAIE